MDAVLAEQTEYYRRRAREYDDWALRVGPLGDGSRWGSEVEYLTRALDRQPIQGSVLELAAGTGNYTVRLATRASKIVAVDASREALAIAQSKLATEACAAVFVEADVFEWRPARRFDCAFFAFWLTHVPLERFEHFWRLVRDSLVPGGVACFVDNATPLEEAAAHIDPAAAAGVPFSRTRVELGTSERELSTGERFTIVKQMWAPDELEAALAALGWTAEVATTPGGAFLHGTVRTKGM